MSAVSGTRPDSTIRMSELCANWGDGAPVAVFLQREVFDLAVVAHFTVVGEPQSKARARVTFKSGKATAYTPRQTQAAEETVAWMFRQAGGSGPDAESTFGVFAAFFCATRQRRDVDNMLKLILDGLNKVAWKDDAQVVEVSGRLTRGVPTGDARTEVVVYRTHSGLAGGLTSTAPCQRCGQPIRVYPSTAARQYCSRKCHDDQRREFTPRVCGVCGKPTTRGAEHCSVTCMKSANREIRTCPGCDKPFPATKRASQKFCGSDCLAADSRQRGVIRPSKATCVDCQAPLSKTKYTRCRACSVTRRHSPVGDEPR